MKEKRKRNLPGMLRRLSLAYLGVCLVMIIIVLLNLFSQGSALVSATANWVNGICILTANWLIHKAEQIELLSPNQRSSEMPSLSFLILQALCPVLLGGLGLILMVFNVAYLNTPVSNVVFAAYFLGAIVVCGIAGIGSVLRVLWYIKNG
jgi:hypothetical protein